MKEKDLNWMFDCSLVVRAFNEEKHIGRLLDGVRQQSMRNVEIIVVDSGSTDKTVDIAKEYGARLVHIAPEEFTFGRSLNKGITVASGSLVVIASAHVYPVYPDWLEKLLLPFEKLNIVLTYGRQIGNVRTKYSERQIFTRWFPEQSESNVEYPFCNNANAAIRKFAWEKHPYDESLTALEDLAWAKWATEHEYSLAYVSDAEVIHVHEETPPIVMNRYKREAMAFKQIFPEAHFNLYDFVRNTLSSIGFDLLHATRDKMLWSSFISIFWFRIAQFWGTYQGFRYSSLMTPSLRDKFYYHVGREESITRKREIDPIRYNE